MSVATIAAALVLASSPTVLGADRDTRSCMVVDDGYLLGTASGVVVLDETGRLRDRLTQFDGLPGARVSSFERFGDEVWVGTEGGVARLHRGAGGEGRAAARWAVHEVRAEGIPVSTLHASKREDALYVGTWGDGLWRVDPSGHEAPTQVEWASAEMTAAQRGTARRITSLAERGGALYVGTAAGLFELKAPASTRTPQLVESSARGLSGYVHSLGVAGDTLWIGELAGVVRVDQDGAPVPAGHADVRAMRVEGQRVIMASYDQGLLVDGRALADRGDVPRGALLAVDIDPQGSKTAGRACATGPEGTFIRDGHGRWRRLELGGLPSADVSALALQTDATGAQRLWAGTFDRGLTMRDPDGDWHDIDGVDPEVNALAVLPAARGVFVGTADGLFHVEAGKVRRFDVKSGLPSARVQALLPQPDGSLIVGTARGIARWENGEIVPITGARIWSVFALAADPQGGIWIGTTKGLVRLGRDGKKIYYSMLGGHLPDDWVTALTFDEEGALYVGTYASGVTRLSFADGRWPASTRKDLGGGRVNIAGLVVRGGKLWVATMDGLLVRELDDAGPSAWHRDREATQGRDVTAVAFEASTPPDGRDRIWIAGRRGVVARSP